MINLRSRILHCGIRCTPWNLWKGEIELLPISSKTLFRKDGVSIDLLEIELGIDCEGYLFRGENLFECIKDPNNLKRYPINHESYEDSTIGEFPDDWTEEDYINNGY